MINVYIKCHSRPVYLDRCLTSLERCAPGYGQIILLNDGLEGACIDRLLERHPGIDVRNSPNVGRNPGEPRADPARFWVDEISRDGGRHMLLIEEDTWFTRPFNLPLLVRNVAQNNTLCCRLYWHSNPQLAPPEDVVFTAIVDDDTVINYLSFEIESALALYKLFPIAQALYRTDYWLHAYQGLANWTDERAVLERALDFTLACAKAGELVHFARLDREAMRHSASTTGRDDAGGRAIVEKIDPIPYNRVLNACWLSGELDAMAGFPEDFPPEDLAALFTRHLGADATLAWRRWRAEYLGMYGRMGSELES